MLALRQTMMVRPVSRCLLFVGRSSLSLAMSLLSSTPGASNAFSNAFLLWSVVPSLFQPLPADGRKSNGCRVTDDRDLQGISVKESSCSAGVVQSVPVCSSLTLGWNPGETVFWSTRNRVTLCPCNGPGRAESVTVELSLGRSAGMMLMHGKHLSRPFLHSSSQVADAKCCRYEKRKSETTKSQTEPPTAQICRDPFV